MDLIDLILQVTDTRISIVNRIGLRVEIDHRSHCSHVEKCDVK